MRRMLLFSVLLMGPAACDLSQYDPHEHWDKEEQARVEAHKERPKLTEKGTLPPGMKKASTDLNSESTEKTAAAVVVETKPKLNIAEIDKTFRKLCANCHGKNGDGDTPMAKALKPAPRDFSDPEWQKKVTDDDILAVIKDGGAAMGKSPVMAPFGGMLSKDELEGMVVKVRSFAKK